MNKLVKGLIVLYSAKITGGGLPGRNFIFLVIWHAPVSSKYIHSLKELQYKYALNNLY
jgi:hypothetical protein